MSGNISSSTDVEQAHPHRFNGLPCRRRAEWLGYSYPSSRECPPWRMQLLRSNSCSHDATRHTRRCRDQRSRPVSNVTRTRWRCPGLSLPRVTCAATTQPALPPPSPPPWGASSNTQRYQLLVVLTATVAAAGTLAPPLAACCRALAAFSASVFDLSALAASLGALSQLGVICYAVRTLSSSGALSVQVAAALSAVSFHLLLPCFMASRLANAPQGSGLAWLPILAAAQVALGAGLGALLWAVVDGSLLAALRSRWARHTQPWHGAERPAPAADAIAASVALAAGVPALAAAVAPPPRTGVQSRSRGVYGPHAWRLVVASCAFGNSVTLPLLLLGGTLSPSDASHVTGLCALFMAGWSPLLWSVAWRLLAPDGCDTSSPLLQGEAQPQTASTQAIRPAPSSFFGMSLASPVAPKPLLALPPPDAPLFSRLRMEHAARVASRRIWEVAEHGMTVTSRTLNPPLVGALVGVLIGATPLRELATDPASGSGVISLGPPPEIALLSTTLRVVLSAASLLAAGVVPVGTLVLATALTAQSTAPPRVEEQQARSHSTESVDVSDVSGALTRGGVAAESVIAVVRLLLMPALTLLIGMVLQAWGWLPPDPLARLLLCTQACMPSAQNLVLLLTLRRGTAGAAAPVAQALVRQYLVAALPCAAWMAAFTKILL
jgi:hypothetical protein